MKVELLFAWYDFWIGLFYDKNKNWLYILPIPMFGVIIKFKNTKSFIQKCIERSKPSGFNPNTIKN